MHQLKLQQTKSEFMSHRAQTLLGFLVFLTGISVHDSTFALAQEQTQTEGHVKLFSQITSRHITPYDKIDKALESQNYDEVNRLFKELEINPELSVIERASLAQFHGHTCIAMDDLHCALAEFKKMLAMHEELHKSTYDQTLYTITQVNFSLENYNDALTYARLRLESQNEPTSDAFILVSQAYYMLENYNQALPNVLNSIRILRDNGSVPKEGTLNLLNAIYRKTGQFEKMLPVLEELIEHYPKDVYQQILSDVTRELKRIQIK